MKVNKSVLIIGLVWPEPNSSAAGLRMMQLIELFQENDFEITFASPAQESEFMFDIATLGVIKQPIELNSESFDLFIKKCNPSIVVFDRFIIEEQFGWRVAKHCPDALRVLDTEDLHCLRSARQNAWIEKREFLDSDLLIEPVSKREIAAILRCDLALIISEFEIELLQNIFKIDAALLYYLPIFTDALIHNEFNKFPAFSQRKDFMFIGNFLHEPNWNAVLYLKETIWPIIREKLPTANLKIYGAYPSQKTLQLNNNKENFFILGRANDAKLAISQAKILLAPLRFGAGIKGKLLEAMQYGTPSITTTIGAEAINGNLPWNGSIENNPEIFAQKAIELYKEEGLWSQAQKNGMSIINSRFLKSFFAADFIKKLLFLQNNLKSHRTNNFIGSMLQHHTVNSAKYMSRWIEEKNK